MNAIRKILHCCGVSVEHAVNDGVDAVDGGGGEGGGEHANEGGSRWQSLALAGAGGGHEDECDGGGGDGAAACLHQWPKSRTDFKGGPRQVVGYTYLVHQCISGSVCITVSRQLGWDG